VTSVGGISRTELDQALREITSLVDQARECGWASDPSGEHRALGIARTLLAKVDDQFADRIGELEEDHAHRAHFDQ
jgi:hypothetical protein